MADLTNLVVGSIVHYGFTNAPGSVVSRPAIVTQKWRNGPPGTVDLRIFLGEGDAYLLEALGMSSEEVAVTLEKGTIWRMQVPVSDVPMAGYWHWPDQS